jgi:hypothetical protein
MISKIETMAGRIVAYSKGLMCLNGNAYWSMLIHVQDHATDVPAQFIEVRFSLPCNKSPEWLTRKSSLRNFRLTYDQDADSVLKEFIDCATESPSGHTSEPCRMCQCGNVFPAQNMKSFHLGSGCQATALWTYLLPQSFDGARGQLLKAGHYTNTQTAHPLRGKI